MSLPFLRHRPSRDPVTAADKPSTGKQSKTIDSLAVLPFENASGDPDTGYLSDGIAESLINTLAQLRKIRVLTADVVVPVSRDECDPLAAGTRAGSQGGASG